MGMVAILIMCPRCAVQTVVPPAHEGSISNLALTGALVFEEEQFEKL